MWRWLTEPCGLIEVSGGRPCRPSSYACEYSCSLLRTVLSSSARVEFNASVHFFLPFITLIIFAFRSPSKYISRPCIHSSLSLSSRTLLRSREGTSIQVVLLPPSLGLLFTICNALRHFNGLEKELFIDQAS